MRFDLDLTEAQQQLLGRIAPLDGERVSLLSAWGRIISEEITAEHDVPLYRQSAVDGFAVSEEAPVGVRFLLRETAITPESEIGTGESYSVATGGLVPLNTRMVVPCENARIEGSYIAFTKEIKSGRNIKSAGEDLQRGTTLASPGTRVDPGLVSAMAAFGYGEVSVYRCPRVGVISLAKGAVPWHDTPGPDQFRDSNGPLLASLVNSDGGEVIAVDLAGDNSPDLKKRALELLDSVDLLIVTGGTHGGEYDEARNLLEEIGAEFLFWGVKIRPGGHPAAALFGSRIIICLSGNPGACMVGYQMLVSPAMRALQGLPPLYPSIKARCVNSFAKEGGPRRLVRANAVVHEDGWRVTVLPGQKSSMMNSSIDCNAFIDLPAGHPPVKADSEVKVILLNPEYSGIYHSHMQQSTGGDLGNE
ncbi:MAG: molybdopterin molybdotransferase MoeA [Syntrophomonadaceae bacterium]|nr:molybdopterin molybdotransferase MoeA [Syntrophomonadaceae bacterium]